MTPMQRYLVYIRGLGPLSLLHLLRGQIQSAFGVIVLRMRARPSAAHACVRWVYKIEGGSQTACSSTLVPSHERNLCCGGSDCISGGVHVRAVHR